MSAQFLPQVKPQFLDANGNPLAYGKVYSYVAGSATLQATYSDREGTIQNSNPVNLDAAGRANIFLGIGEQYKITVKNVNDVEQYTVDKVYGQGFAGFGNGWVNVVNYGADGTGVADSTAAIIDAMEAASTIGGGVVYLPAGTYRITSTITNATAPDFIGFVGDDPWSTVIDASGLTTDALVFTDIPSGSRFENFRVEGPGQNAAVTSSGIRFLLSSLNNVYGQVMTNVRMHQFPTYGFQWQVPITASFNALVSQECGTAGFYVNPKTGQYVGGTSTSWNGCYANNTIGSGYKFQGHGYFAMNACAADNCNISYELINSYCASLGGLGSEVNTYIDASNPGVGIYAEGCYGLNIKGLWSYNSPNVASRQIIFNNSYGSTVMNCSGYTDNGISPAYECELQGACEKITFIQNYRIGNDTAPTYVVADTWRIDEGSGIDIVNLADGHLTGVEFDIPDVYGNSLYIRNGALAISATAGAGALNIFNSTYVDYPTASLVNDGSLSFGPGATATDTTISRAGANLINLPNVSGSLTVKGSSNPQLIFNNTGQTQQWAVSGDNGKGLAIYDSTNAASTAYFYRDNAGEGVNRGLLQLSKGLRVEGGGRLYVKDYGNSASGSAIFAASTTCTVANTLVTADSHILVTLNAVYSGSPQWVYVSARTPGTGFTLTASGSLDGAVSYLIIEP